MKIMQGVFSNILYFTGYNPQRERLEKKTNHKKVCKSMPVVLVEYKG